MSTDEIRHLEDKIKKYYPPSQIAITDRTASQYVARHQLCQEMYASEVWQNKWKAFKDDVYAYFDENQLLVQDIELISDAPSFKIGLVTQNDASYFKRFSFYISVIDSYYGWSFIDWENYPKGDSTTYFPAPPKSLFIEHQVAEEYNKLKSGRVTSLNDLELAPTIALSVFRTRIRLTPLSKEETELIQFFADKAAQIFENYTAIDKAIALRELHFLSPKSEHPLHYMTMFDCLFTGELSYT